MMEPMTYPYCYIVIFLSFCLTHTFSLGPISGQDSLAVCLKTTYFNFDLAYENLFSKLVPF